MKMKLRLTFSLILVCSLLVVNLGVAQQGSKEERYSYYYKGSLISLNPSKRFIAIEEGVPRFSSFVKNNQLVKDPLSERASLKNRSLGLYRAPVPKGKKERKIDLRSRIPVFSDTTGGIAQPVFEQGETLLIPTDEVIAGFKNEITLPEVQAYLAPYLNSLRILEIREHRVNTFILKIDNPSNGRAFEVARQLSALDQISFSEPNHIVIMLGNTRLDTPLLKKKFSDEKFITAYRGAKGSLSNVTIQSNPQWITLASLDFESETLPEGWTVGSLQESANAYWGATAYQAHGGSHSLHCAAQGDEAVNPPEPVPVNMLTGLLSPLLDLSIYEEVYFELWFYAKNELGQDENRNLTLLDGTVVYLIDADSESFYGAPLMIPYDGNCTIDPTTSNGWRRFLFRIPPFLRVPNAQFIVLYFSDDSNQTEGAYIDDIRIVGASDVDTEPLSNDIYSGRQYELKNVGQIAGLVNSRNDMHVPEAWEIVSVSPDITVAVIDDGVELNHPDLNLVTGYDPDGSVGGQPRGNPRGGHGTNCAGNVGAVKDNGIGVVGTAPGVKIMPVYRGNTTAENAQAIDVAVNHGAQILTNSWGGVGSPSTDIENAIKAALTAGRIVLFAAGNGPDRPPYTYDVGFPGNLTETTDVICVGASSPTDEHKSASSSDGEFSWGSSYVGPGPDVVAPGSWSYTTDLIGEEGYNNGAEIDPSDITSADYSSSFGGTSSSTPKVAGIVALMLSKNPNLTPSEVKAILKNTADDIDAPGTDDKTGAGRVNAFKAVSAVNGAGIANAFKPVSSIAGTKGGVNRDRNSRRNPEYHR